MNKRIIALCLVLLNISTSSAQDTYYFQLTRKIIDGNSSTKVAGGQFITFIGDICYESDIDGIAIGNGKLSKNSNYSNETYIVYDGKSYWDNHSTFRVNKDRSVLNIITEKGDVYIYKRATPPNGVVTCSLIKEKQQNTGGSSSGVQPVYVPTPIAVGSQTPTTAPTQPTQSNTVTTPSKKWRSITREVDCSFCHHSGKCSTCNGKGWYYNTYGSGTVNCPNCRNGWCTHCNGRGSITKTEMVYE